MLDSTTAQLRAILLNELWAFADGRPKCYYVQKVQVNFTQSCIGSFNTCLCSVCLCLHIQDHSVTVYKCSLNTILSWLPCIFTQTRIHTNTPLSLKYYFQMQANQPLLLFICMAVSLRILKYGITVVLGFAQVLNEIITCFKEFWGHSYSFFKLHKFPETQAAERITDKPVKVTSKVFKQDSLGFHSCKTVVVSSSQLTNPSLNQNH